MIKETDASKSDERRVKNKPNPLTHKRKGETRTMYNQSTKHWKLGALFVISLMLVAGLFSNTASAQTPAAEITVDPTTSTGTGAAEKVTGTFYAGDIVDLTVTYKVTARAIDPGNDNVDGTDDNLATDPANLPGGENPQPGDDPEREDVNVIVFTLPSDVGAAYDSDRTIDTDNSAVFILNVTEHGDGLTALDPPDVAIPEATSRGGTRRVKVIKPNATSYITWDVSLSAGLKVVTTPTISGQTVTVTVTRDDESKATMKKGNTVTVTYHNVMVGDDVVSFEVSADDDVDELDPTTTTNLIDRRDVAPPAAVAVNVDELEPLDDPVGNVEVTPASVPAEGTVDLMVKYNATKGLAIRPSKATDAEDLDSTYGRIRITLPEGWGPDGDGEDNLSDPNTVTTLTDNGMIYEKRQSDSSKTYLSWTHSGGVVLRKDDGKPNDAVTGNPFAISVIPTIDSDGGNVNDTGWQISIDVDKMVSRQHLTLTINNLEVPKLTTDRLLRITDISEEKGEQLFQVEVTSQHYATPALRNVGAPLTPPKDFDPEDLDESDEQPTITLTRRTQGKLTLSKDEVNAGSEEDFDITYRADANMGLAKGEVIEIRLPDGWAAPEVYQLDDDKPTSAERDASDASYVYLTESSRLDGTTISLIDKDGNPAYFEDGERDTGVTVSDGWFVQIVLGKAVSRNSTVVLNYNDVTVQRGLTSDDDPALIEAFSGPVVDADGADILPQFPVEEQKKIKVVLAADGSGEVTFAFNGATVKPLGDGSKVKANAAESIPAGIVAADAHSLVLTYVPVGDMGEGEFEFRMPSGWSAKDILTSGDTKTTPAEGEVKAGTTITSELPEHFGETAGYQLDITLVDVTIPNKHGDQGLVAKSKKEGGTLKQLKSRPKAFIGNTMAANDTVTVEITPAAAYVNQDNVDFEITLTANGPMHDSEIRITLPEGLADLEDDPAKSAEDNHVRKVSASVSGVVVDADPNESNEGIILIKTAELNTGGKIKIRYDNVDLADVDPAPTADPSKLTDEGFRVETRTRGFDPESDDGYVSIEKDDGDRSIVGGLIRTVEGSGTMVVAPATLEQSSRNKNFKLTFTATTDFPAAGLDLVITVPDVIETELHEGSSSSDGYVSTSTSKFHADKAAADRLVIAGSTITWAAVVLDKGEKFITNIRRVDLLEDTGDFRWETTLGGTNILDADNLPMVVVGTMADDVVFEVVDDSGIPESNPSYPASSLQSIRFQFTTSNTAIQPGGSVWFTIPVGWSYPSTTDKKDRATVSIVHLVDGEETFVSKIPEKAGDGKKAGEQMELTVQGRSVILTIGDGEGAGLAEGDTVTIRYGDSDDPKKFPVAISSSAKGTADNDEDGLSIRGRFEVADEFRQRDAGTIWVDITNVADGSGTATIGPDSVRAGSTKNLMTVTFTGVGTMDGGAVRLIIPEDWGAMQDEDNLKRNYIEVDVSGTGAALDGDPEILDDGLTVVATLKTFGNGNKVEFTYGGGRGGRENRGATSPSRDRRGYLHG